MSKAKKVSAVQGNYNSCYYYCNQEELVWTLYEDNSEPGYYCPEELGNCVEGDDTLECDAYEIEGLVASVPKLTLPKDSALYLLEPTRKLVRRVKGKWSKGMKAPLEITFAELAKIDKKLAETAVSMAKNKSIVGAHIIVPAQKSSGGSKKKVATKKKAPKPSTKSITKKATGKASKKSS